MNGQGSAGQPVAHTLGLLGKLMATVRAEFRADVLVFDGDDPILAVLPAASRGVTARPRAMACVKATINAGRSLGAQT